MNRWAIVFSIVVAATLVGGTALAGPPADGVYKSTDLGGSIFDGHYTEGYLAANGAPLAGTVLNSESWDGTTLGTQWRYWCGETQTDGQVIQNTVDANGNGSKTFMKTFVGGFIWLSGTGPWANGDADYPGVIDTYVEIETVLYQNFVRQSAVTNVNAVAHFDAYPNACLTFAIGNGAEVGSTDFGMMKPAEFPDALDNTCTAGAANASWWNFFSITLTVSGCSTPAQESTWGGLKSLYRE